MPTPAVNENSWPQLPWPIFLNGNVHSTATMARQQHVLVRPASSTSPIRSDGTRAPQSWGVRWAAMQNDVRSRSWPFFGDYMFTYSGPGYEVNLERFAQELSGGAAWATGGGIFPISVESEARTRALLKLMSNQAQLGAALGELKQTGRLVEKLCNDTFNAVSKISRGVKRSPRAVFDFLTSPYNTGKKKKPSSRPPDWKAREAESVVNNWMEYQFGVIPLVHDIQDIGQALSDSLFEQAVPLVVRIKAGAEEEYYRTLKTPYGPQGIPAQFEVAARHKASCHISALYEIPVTPENTLNRLGLGNPYSVAWELTQASWLVDYAIGVGDWLQTLTSHESGRLKEGSISKKLVVDFPAPGGYTRLPAGATGFGSETLDGEFGRFHRETLTLLLPALTPPLRGKIGLTQVANAVSYLAQSLKGNPPHLRL